MAIGRLAFVFLLLSVALSGCSSERRDAAQGRPNVILISIDTLNRSALRAFEPEAPVHPSIDRLAARSRVFTRAYSSASWTLPAHASLFTGLYPDRHRAVARRWAFSGQAVTLAGVLRDNGYRTVACTGGGYLNPVYGFERGFERYDFLPRGEVGTVADNAPALFAKGTAFLEERSGEDPPFFLFLHTYALHNYFKIQPWARAGIPDDRLRSAPYYFRCLRGERRGSVLDWKVLEGLYRAELEAVDEALGGFLEVLERLQLSEETLVVFLSDHGEGFAPERGRVHHAGRLHADLLRIPLILGGPKVPPGLATTPVSVVDVMPTVLDYLRIEAPEGLDGASFGQALLGREQARDRPLVALEYSYAWQAGKLEEVTLTPDAALSRAVICDDLWYIEGPGGEELYDMRSDPEQRHSLVGDLELLEDLRRRDRLWRQGRDALESGAEIGVDLDAQLRALGYVE